MTAGGWKHGNSAASDASSQPSGTADDSPSPSPSSRPPAATRLPPARRRPSAQPHPANRGRALTSRPVPSRRGPGGGCRGGPAPARLGRAGPGGRRWEWAGEQGRAGQGLAAAAQLCGVVAGWVRGLGGEAPRGAGDRGFPPAAGPERVSGSEGRTGVLKKIDSIPARPNTQGLKTAATVSEPVEKQQSEWRSSVAWLVSEIYFLAVFSTVS